MKQKGISQRELAEKAGCHYSYISLIANGLRFPRPDILDRIAGALGITPEECYRLLRDQQRGQASA